MGQRTAAFIDAMGGAQADLLVVEWSDRDAGSGLAPLVGRPGPGDAPAHPRHPVGERPLSRCPQAPVPLADAGGQHESG